MHHFSKEIIFQTKSGEKARVHSFALIMLLGFELSYYLLIVQTGITQHFHSDLFTLFPLFVGGVLGTYMSGLKWGTLKTSQQKILVALFVQGLLSFLYPNYNSFMLFILGMVVGTIAPLSIYIFQRKQVIELLAALAIAYTTGTYFFTSYVDFRMEMAIVLSLSAFVGALFLNSEHLDQKETTKKLSKKLYVLPVIWILLDSQLFETLLRNPNIDIWSYYTYQIIFFHLLGLFVAYFTRRSKFKHIAIGLLFVLSYLCAYNEYLLTLTMIYPFVISYYNVVVFSLLSKEGSLRRLSLGMIFIAWFASGSGLALALSKIF